MSWRDVEWSEMEIQPVGLNEGVDPRVLPPDQLTQLKNCDVSTKAGHIQKRPGTVLSAPKNSLCEEAHKLVTLPIRNQLLYADLKGKGGGSGVSPKLWAYPDAIADGSNALPARAVGEISDVLIRRNPVAVDLQTDYAVDQAFVKTTGPCGYLVYGTLQMQTGNIGVKVFQVRTSGSAWEPEHLVIETGLAFNSETYGTPFQVRAAPYNDTHVLVTWSADNGYIVGAIVDCSGASPTVGGVQVIANDVPFVPQRGYHDLCESTVDTNLAAGTPNWYIGYANEGGLPLFPSTTRVLRVYSNAGTLTVQWTTDVFGASSSTTRAISVYEQNGYAWVNWWNSGSISGSGTVEDPVTLGNPAWRYACVDSGAGTIVRVATVWCDSTDIGANPVSSAGWISAIGGSDTDTEAFFFHSQHIDWNRGGAGYQLPNAFFDRHTTRWRRGNTSGTTGVLRQWAGVYILSKPRRAYLYDTYTMWVGTNYASERVEYDPEAAINRREPPYDKTAILLRFNDSDIQPTVMIGSAAGLTLGNPAILHGAYSGDTWVERGFQQGQSVTHGTRYNDADADSLGMRTCFNVRYVPLEGKSGAWDVVVRSTQSEDFPDGYARCEQAHFGNSVYMAGGVLMQWDGSRCFESGFVRAPNLQAAHILGPTAWDIKWAEKQMFFQVVYETVCNGNERVRSATSAVRSITHNGTAGSVAPTGDITLFFDPPPASMRDVGIGATKDTPAIIAAIYGSDEPDSTALHRLFEFDASAWADSVVQPGAGHYTVTFNGVTYGSGATKSPYNAGWWTEIGTHEVIYNDGGELDNDLPYGGCSAIVVHKDRLWIGGGEDAEVVWYSKERVDGRPAEFALGQQIRIPGVKVTALASIGDTLLVFCKDTIYAVYGDGPNATGDPNSGYFTVRPLSTTVGAASQSCVVTVPGGVLFYSGDDLYSVDAGGGVSRVGSAIEDSYNRVAFSTSLVPHRRQVRVQVGGASSGESGPTSLVFDWEKRVWATWEYTYGDYDGYDVVDIKTLNGRTYLLKADGTVYREVTDGSTYADAGSAYTQVIRFGWLTFGRMLGYKVLRHMRLWLQSNPWADYSASPTSYPFGLKLTMDFNSAESGFGASRQWASTQIGAITPRDGIALLGLYVPRQNEPSMRLTIEETAPVKNLAGNVGPYNTVGANGVRIDLVTSGGVGDTLLVTLTEDAALTGAQAVAEIMAVIDAAGYSDQITCYLNSSDRIVFETVWASDIDLAAGSANTALGFAAGGQASGYVVDATARSGAILQAVAFEVGQIRGPQRLPAAQSR